MLFNSITTKKDLFYWVLGLAIYSYFITTKQLSKSKELVDYIGFAATILSIVLAIIAIIYSFIQTLTTDGAIEKLDKSAKRIEKITDGFMTIQELPNKIDSSVNKLVDISEDFQKIQETVISMQQTVCGIEKSVSDSNVRLGEFVEQFGGNSTGKIDAESLDKAKIAEIVTNSTGRYGIAILYYLFLCSEKKISLNLAEFGKKVLNNDNFFKTAQGYLAPIRALGLLKINFKKKEVIILKELKNAIEAIEEKKRENYQKIEEFVNQSDE